MGRALRRRARRAVRSGPGARSALSVSTPRHARRAAPRQLADDSVARHADGADHSVVVTALGYDHVRLSRTAALRAAARRLSFYWFGDHLLLWRPGEAPARDLAPGSTTSACAGCAPRSRRWRASPSRATHRRSTTPRSSTACAGFNGSISSRRRHRRRAHADRDVRRPRPPTPLPWSRSTDASFILDAFRKSEHERQRSTVPGLAQVPLATPQPQLPRWAVIVMGVLAAVVVALGGAWWTSIRAPAAS